MALTQLACWNVFLPIWRLEVLNIAMWYWWIHGRLEAFVSTGVHFIKCMLAPTCDSTLQLFLYYCHPFFPTAPLTTSAFVSGARDLQCPPQSAFSSSPTSLSRPRGPRHFCCKRSARAGPTAWSAAPRRPSARTCSMRCTKLQVNNAPHHHLHWTEQSEHNRQPARLRSSGLF